MKTFALLIALMATPAIAETPCGGLADTLGILYTNGFIASVTGKIEDADVTVYVHEDGRFIVVYTRGETACIIQQGLDWGPVKPQA